MSDSRTRLVHGDFFAMLLSGEDFDPEAPGRRVHAILVDIDHSPRHVLDPSHVAFHTADGLRSVVRRLLPGGVFTLWSDDPPDAEFTTVLKHVFDGADAHVVTFANPLTGGQSASTMYVARCE